MSRLISPARLALAGLLVLNPLSATFAALCPAPGESRRETLPPEHIEWSVNAAQGGYYGVTVRVAREIGGLPFERASAGRRDEGGITYFYPLRTERFYNGRAEFSFLASEGELRRLELSLLYRGGEACPGADVVYTATFLGAAADTR